MFSITLKKRCDYNDIINIFIQRSCCLFVLLSRSWPYYSLILNKNIIINQKKKKKNQKAPLIHNYSILLINVSSAQLIITSEILIIKFIYYITIDNYSYFDNYVNVYIIS